MPSATQVALHLQLKFVNCHSPMAAVLECLQEGVIVRMKIGSNRKLEQVARIAVPQSSARVCPLIVYADNGACEPNM